MTAADARGPGEAAVGINQLEGYLLWQAETDRARDSAREFSASLPWLTIAQREEVEHAYTQDRLEQSKVYLVRIAGRCRELQHEYQQRYDALRRRLAIAFVVGSCLTLTLAVLLGALLTAG
ncbi:hypothetical protein NGB36_03270 [Streptomyces sp. RB6PN25]|uniref:Cytochrome C oxidase subunit I n=1 Tax=Streptomyces humicola TaxID=2953240 RepID=A0ABT1PPP4_9ACTN|nr:hypothetical protein [Streptomyces humicola]MCQ4079644.1 hypothetical protein [Streptomyces humicola]